jgi:ribosomal protein L40E
VDGVKNQIRLNLHWQAESVQWNTIMTKKSLGYVELEWECPNCNGRNSGNDEVCIHCGAAQPQDVKFEQPAEEKIIEDATVIDRAVIGPDIHCAYCGTRNPADAQHCSQCGAELAEGTARESGEVLGAHRDKPAQEMKCDYCGTLNPGTAHKCQNCGANLQFEELEPAAAAPESGRSGLSTPILIVAGVILVIACIGIFIFLNRTEDVQGQVSDLSWERTIVIMGMAPAALEGWRDEIPQEAELGLCSQEHRYTSDDPQPNSTEVCGTPYTVDTGSGLGEVVQDCQYQVYDDRCQYTILQLQAVDELALSGTDRNPEWPIPKLLSGQQEGERQESYRITFSADGEEFTYATSSVEEYLDFVLGSNWVLKVNQLGGVTDVEPAP